MKAAQNQATGFSAKLFKSEIAQCDSSLLEDYCSILEGGCIYLPQFLCAAEDYTLLQSLAKELADGEDHSMINWSKHLKHENPSFSNSFNCIIQKMADYFDVEVYATRLNFYPDGISWKPFHHDSHAYGGQGKREDFTMGASFGATRQLVFLHPPSGMTFEFPQVNGDVFAFNSEVNRRFQHGLPKSKNNVGPRFSVIAWGRRRTINERNGGAKGQCHSNMQSVAAEAENLAEAQQQQRAQQHSTQVAMTVNEAVQLVDRFVQQRQKNKKGASEPAGGGGGRATRGKRATQRNARIQPQGQRRSAMNRSQQ
ncbi:Fe2OG dioxygenase domain-containing protein [Balamuthia mandrillaris]